MVSYKNFQKENDDRSIHIAKKILREFKLLHTWPIPIESIIRTLKINLCKISNPGWDGAANSENKISKTPTIWVNSNCNFHRQRFAMAHELGHILYHEPGIYRDADFNPSTNEEKDANEFALALLVPLHLLEDMIHEKGITNEILSNTFEVSVGCIGVQLERLR